MRPGGGVGIRRGRGRLEQEVLTVVETAERPLTPTEVREQLPDGGGLAYTTVMTVLARLHEKGHLTREKRGRSYAYAPPADPVSSGDSAVARRMRQLLDRGADRRGVLARFVAELGQEDEAALAALLRVASDEPERDG